MDKEKNINWNASIDDDFNPWAYVCEKEGEQLSYLYISYTAFNHNLFLEKVNSNLSPKKLYEYINIETSLEDGKVKDNRYPKHTFLKLSNETYLYIHLYDVKEEVFMRSDGTFTESKFERKLEEVNGYIYVFYKQENKDKAEDVASLFKGCLVEETEESRLHMIIQTKHGFELKDFSIKPLQVDLDLNYGTAFKEINSIFLNALNNKSKGLVLLHGEPGTGKTSYIRQLIHHVPKKKLIYIPPEMTSALTDPAFVQFLSGYPNSVLIIEDAENVIKTRKAGGSHAIANLLNMTDGLLGDCLAMQIVATFNCPVSEIDSALLRKGRLIGKHEFKPLPVEDAQKLSDSLGYKNTITTPMTLADIYNQDDKDFKEERQTIGFKTNS